ncbi:MAG: enolase C-terminal domain-like protein [candidate division Zixibacteria bacterium]|nr:enolase C-terminal domain-like protein [candidate division Zixibacteria bacterium]
MHLEVFKVALPLKKKFAVSQGEATVKTNLITILNNRYNGEASGSVYYGPTLDEMEKEINKGIELLSEIEQPKRETLDVISNWDIHPVAKSALNGMVLNFLSGETQRYPWEIMNLGTPVGIKSSFTVSIDSISEMKEVIKNSEYPIIKVKMGHEEDLLILDILDQVKDKEIRVDANGGWSCSKAEEMIYYLSQKGVKIIEQPTDKEFVEEWNHLKGKADVLLIMDEGLNNLADYEKYSKFIDGINIKMDKSGGIVEGIKLANTARNENKKVMLGCMVETSIGISQSVYMSSLADYFDLDGPLLLENDIAHGIKYDRESIEVDREIIGGPKLKRDVIKKYIKE